MILNLYKKYPQLSVLSFLYFYPLLLITIVVGLLGWAVLMVPAILIVLPFAMYIPPLIILGMLPVLKRRGGFAYLLLAVCYLISGTPVFYIYGMRLANFLYGNMVI